MKHQRSTSTVRFGSKRGSVMVEMVFVAPFILLLIILTLYNGYEATRITKSQVMLRYEVEREVKQAEGPSRSVDNAHSELMEAFFANSAQSIEISASGDAYPMDVPDALIEEIDDNYEDAVADLQQAWYYRDTNDRRLRHGRRGNTTVLHPNLLPYSELINGPITRRFGRIDLDWRFNYSQFASADEWEGIRPTINNHNHEENWESDFYTSNHGMLVHYKRAVRDVFLFQLDEALDGIDGQRNAEYGQGPREHPNNDTWAGALRRIYLTQPQYVGPLVYEEGENEED